MVRRLRNWAATATRVPCRFREHRCPQLPSLILCSPASARCWMKHMERALNASCSMAHARGDARPDSDYDVAVFLRDKDNRDPELYRAAGSARALPAHSVPAARR